MKRILITQNEKNNGEDYVVVNGELVKDADLSLQYFRELREADNWNQNYKDDFFELKNNDTSLFLKSHYMDKDNLNRNIYYMYLIENTDNLEAVLNFLESDSKVIPRNIDREKTLEVIKRIKGNRRLKTSIFKLIMVLVAASVAYLILNKIK